MDTLGSRASQSSVRLVSDWCEAASPSKTSLTLAWSIRDLGLLDRSPRSMGGILRHSVKLTADNPQLHETKILSMANNGKNTNRTLSGLPVYCGTFGVPCSAGVSFSSPSSPANTSTTSIPCQRLSFLRFGPTAFNLAGTHDDTSASGLAEWWEV